MSGTHKVEGITDPEYLEVDFFRRDTVSVAKDLLGKYLVTEKSGSLCAGRIVETEAYLGEQDRASHASCGVTERNRVMFGPPGVSYVYLIYGMHHCFNIVCEREGTPGAVLFRAIQPETGLEVMKQRRGRSDMESLTSGPARLTQALDISLKDNCKLLPAEDLYVLNGSIEGKVCVSGRIGISKSSHLEYRFFIEGNRFVSG